MQGVWNAGEGHGDIDVPYALHPSAAAGFQRIGDGLCSQIGHLRPSVVRKQLLNL